MNAPSSYTGRDLVTDPAMAFDVVRVILRGTSGDDERTHWDVWAAWNGAPIPEPFRIVYGVFHLDAPPGPGRAPAVWLDPELPKDVAALPMAWRPRQRDFGVACGLMERALRRLHEHAVTPLADPQAALMLAQSAAEHIPEPVTVTLVDPLNDGDVQLQIRSIRCTATVPVEDAPFAADALNRLCLLLPEINRRTARHLLDRALRDYDVPPDGLTANAAPVTPYLISPEE